LKKYFQPELRAESKGWRKRGAIGLLLFQIFRRITAISGEEVLYSLHISGLKGKQGKG